MTSTERSLIGSVFERKASTAPSPRFTNAPSSGFPAVQHRSKSAFARAREDERSSINSRTKNVPLVLPTRPTEQTRPREVEVDIPANDDAIRRQISEENERRIANMSQEEREQERRDIIDQLGNGVGDLLERVRAARSRNSTKTPAVVDDIPVQKEQVPEVSREIPIVSPLPGLAARPNLSRVKSLEDFGKRGTSCIPEHDLCIF